MKRLAAVLIAVVLALGATAPMAASHGRTRVGRVTARVKALEVTVAQLQTTIQDHENRIVALETPGNKP